jgi:hypothetical protein
LTHQVNAVWVATEIGDVVFNPTHARGDILYERRKDGLWCNPVRNDHGHKSFFDKRIAKKWILILAAPVPATAMHENQDRCSGCTFW